MEARIMIVEDEVIFALELHRRLEDCGHTVVANVTTGEAAMSRAEQVQPDLVLMDINLAGEIDGIQTAEKLRLRCQAPVVFITAFADEERIGRAKLTLPFGYMLKPIDDRELRVTIEMALHLHQADQQRKQAEEALRQSEANLAKAQQVAHLGSWERNLTSGERTWSDEFFRILGYEPQAVTPSDEAVIERIHPDDRERVAEIMGRCLGSGRAAEEFEHRIVRPNGTQRYVQGKIWLQEDIDGKPGTVRGTMLDLTERKRSEEAMLSLEQQMLHAQKLESLGVLAGGIAHDFNNLLTAILGNADLALDELSPHAPARDNIMEIERASKRAAELAKQMLAYSGKGRFVIEPIDLNELIREMAHLLDVTISKKAVIKYNFAENLPTFDGDATQIRQIIMNLITNSSDAIGDRSGVIALSTGALDCERAYLDSVNEILHTSLDEPLPEGIYCCLEVSDTGCGMDPETTRKIFDPFFTTKVTGRGLGLSAVLGIVRGHCGAINIYSEVGKGTTFRLLFPSQALPSDDAAAESGEGKAEAWQGQGTVLIVDDEDTVLSVGKKMLERLAFSVLTAPDGRKAVEVYRQHADEIVCVLLDLSMPHMDGEQALHEIRRINPDAKVALCSGYSMQDASERFAGIGLDALIQKPYSIASLRAELKELLAVSG